MGIDAASSGKISGSRTLCSNAWEGTVTVIFTTEKRMEKS